MFVHGASASFSQQFTTDWVSDILSLGSLEEACPPPLCLRSTSHGRRCRRSPTLWISGPSPQGSSSSPKTRCVFFILLNTCQIHDVGFACNRLGPKVVGCIGASPGVFFSSPSSQPMAYLKPSPYFSLSSFPQLTFISQRGLRRRGVGS